MPILLTSVQLAAIDVAASRLSLNRNGVFVRAATRAVAEHAVSAQAAPLPLGRAGPAATAKLGPVVMAGPGLPVRRSVRLPTPLLDAIDTAATQAGEAIGRTLTRNEFVLGAAMREAFEQGVRVEDPNAYPTFVAPSTGTRFVEVVVRRPYLGRDDADGADAATPAGPPGSVSASAISPLFCTSSRRRRGAG